MTSIRSLIAAAVFATAAAAAAEGTTVVSLRVVPGAARTDVMIGVSGTSPVTLRDFTLSSPNKIVLDVSGATLGLQTGDSYDRVARGGIVDVRYSQFNRTTVRVVLTLDAPHAYTVKQSASQIEVSVDGASTSTAEWTARSSAASALATVTPQGTAPAPAMHAAPAQMLALAHEAPPVTGNARAPGSDAPAPAVQQPSQQPPITINALDEDIRDVLAEFQEFSGRTIIPGRNVTGKVTAYIVNKPWDVALRALLNANGFDATVDQNGIIIVDTYQNIAARQSAEPVVTENVRLNYARAVSVAPMVQQRLSRDCGRAGFSSSQNGGTVPNTNSATSASQPPAGSNVPTQTQEPSPTPTVTINVSCPVRGAVTFDSLTNSISITDIPSQVKALEDYAKSLDLRQPQVNIKAKIILVDRTSLEALGLRYDLGTANQFFNQVVPRLDSSGTPLTGVGQVALGGNTVAAIANASQRVAGAALQLVYSTAMGNFDLTTFLEALRTTSLVDVQAEPSASVLNNRTANLTAGTQVPIRVIDAGAGGNQTGGFPTASVKLQQTGVILTVTPQVTANHQVQMRVHVENSDVQFQSNDVGAVFPTQAVDNEVLVADGETAVMGGLTQTTVNVQKSGIPILVDLPIIGRLFGVTQRQETKRDLLILITPHIIDPGQSPDGGN